MLRASLDQRETGGIGRAVLWHKACGEFMRCNINPLKETRDEREDTE
jgi:hypothetical protein